MTSDKSPFKLNLSPSDDEVLKALVKTRGIIKSRLTRLSNYVNNLVSQDLPIQKRIDLKLRMKATASLLSEFNDVQTQIEKTVPDADLDKQLTKREQFEDSYYNVLARAECILDSYTEVNASPSASNSNLQSIKLPTINMPTFDGVYEHWLEFRDTFISLVHNSKEISSIQKFHYLKSSLKGSAELVIDSLEFSASNYAVAWELLLNRYNNNRLLVHNHVKSLFSIAKISKESPHTLRRLIDTILKNLRALKILGEPVDHWDTLVIYIITSKLDETTEREWEQYKGTSLNQPESKKSLKVDDLIKFLKDRADMLETLLVSHSPSYKFSQDNKKQHFTSHNKIQCNVSTNKPQQGPRNCPMCNANHPLYSCERFLDSDLNSKLKLISKHKLCENCLRSGHSLGTCKFGPCRKCNKKHNTLIHNDSSDTDQAVSLHSFDTAASTGCTPPAASPPPADTIPLQIPFSQVNSAHIDNDLYHSNQPARVGAVLLSTALVEVADAHNRYHLARALLDSGSQHCFITQRLCDTLNANILQSTYEIRGIGNSITQSTQICDVEIKSRIKDFSKQIRCFVLPNITSTLPAACKHSAQQFRVPNNIQLADPQYFESQNIDLLLGADIFWELLCDGKMRLPNGPFLHNTLLGWIVSGPINTRNNSRSVLCNFSHSVDDIDAQLRRFWELEELPRPGKVLTDEEHACENHFVATTTRESDGRFCVRIPFKESPDMLGESLAQAERRFFALEKRLDRNPSYKQLYADFIHEYISLGHMTRVYSYDKPHYFMPHHGVFREHSTTTKLRAVFDASAATTTGKSLNDLQLVGPPIQSDLVAILLRFRQHRYTACADIEKMYRQCLVHESQRDLQLIVWRDDPSEPLGIYRLNTVTYGTASAPFLSVRCLMQLALDCVDPDVKRIITDHFYVDDMILSMDNKFELLKLCEKTKDVLKSGCFPLRKWVFNFEYDQSLTSISTSKDLALGENVQSKTLGLGLFHATDEFHFQTQFKNDTAIVTKRTILSHVSQIFDPLGLLSPTIMIAKVLLQRLWLLQLDWDDEVPSDVTRAWGRFVNGLSALTTIRIPRQAIASEAIRIELHIFTDASQTAYGACVYVRTVTNQGITVRLLCSKGKVAPIKPVSIPRLELCGALLGARLYDKVHKSLTCHFDNVMFWTDSTIVLGWLHMSPNLQKTFVQNRTAEIHELAKELPWRHVNGKENPADLVSRGVSMDDLSSSSFWWEGPAFLHEPSFRCTELPTQSLDTQDLPELKSSATHAFISEPVQPTFFPFVRFSQFARMRRAMAYVHRFIHNARNKNNKRTDVLTVDELREADRTLVRLAQLESFPGELASLSKNGTLASKHSLLKLNLFLDDDRIIRVGGRIVNSPDFSFDKKHPILLAAKHHFTLLLFRHEHKNLFHAGPQALLFNIREMWWPIAGRNLARAVVHGCVTCRRLRGKTLTPLMGNLPEERITPGFPFMHCGVDYAGPMFILNRKGRGASVTKCYVCLFVCFVTRAIHLEVASDLSSDAYLLALKRFISRRGKPIEIVSDNGTNFVGVANEFAKFLSSCSPEIIEYATSQNIRFKFSVPHTPHFGGLMEAGVKSCKYHLRRVIGNSHLTFEEFSTVLAQIEAILNSRPLSPMSSDPSDFNPLSPGHFLVGRPLTAPATKDIADEPAHRLSRYQRVEQIRQQFWTRWAKEYISELQTRIKWRKNTTNLQPGTLVIIKDDRLPPLKWHLGRIIKTIPGKDGVCRVADIQTASGIVRRAFVKICPLIDQ
ncbi:hypothetical protein ABMA28_005724 [Loxostege sticticalis]|uniref:Integrase catalytic domain-containing protein n=1 Tax=Loxostege sticticalis TaxID=481309 RepID=A0ABD0SMM8_LOXSC